MWIRVGQGLCVRCLSKAFRNNIADSNHVSCLPCALHKVFSKKMGGCTVTKLWLMSDVSLAQLSVWNSHNICLCRDMCTYMLLPHALQKQAKKKRACRACRANQQLTTLHLVSLVGCTSTGDGLATGSLSMITSEQRQNWRCT